MRWINHNATAFCVTYAVSANPVLSVIAAVSATVPDALEHFPLFHRHRGLSHDILLWVPVSSLLWIMTYVPVGGIMAVPHLAGLLQLVALGLILGVIMHLTTDGLSASGVPVLRKYRFAAGWYKTFTWSEYKVSLCICLPCLAVCLALGRLSPKLGNLMMYLNLA
jgi:hypothetical protein